MRRFIVALALAAVFAGSVCLLGADTLKGSIGDKMCGAKHMGSDAVKCTTACVKKGSAYILIVGDKTYDIDNASDAKVAPELAKHAGHNVEVTGTMAKDGKSVKIDSIKMPK